MKWNDKRDYMRLEVREEFRMDYHSVKTEAMTGVGAKTGTGEKGELSC